MKIRNIEGLSADNLQQEADAGARFVYFPYTISLLLITLKRTSDVYMIRAGESAAARGRRFTLISLFLGWWGIPYGPKYTIESIRTNRRLFRGMVHLTESQSWQWAFQIIAENSRWDLPGEDVERHMAVAFEYVMEGLAESNAAPHRLDPAGQKALGLAKQMRRRALQGIERL